MRCPKCGFNSFDHLDACKKCGKDLTEHKTRFGIKSILLSEIFSTKKEPATPEESVDTDIAIAPEPKDTPDTSVEAMTEEANDLGFDFTIDSEENEEPAFYEQPEETSIEDDSHGTLSPPRKGEEAVTFVDDGLDDPSAFDLEEPKTFETDIGLTADRNVEDQTSIETDLGLNERSDDFSFPEETSELKEDPDRPFDCKEVLRPEGLSITNEENTILDGELQEELFTGNAPVYLPESQSDVPPMESHGSFGEGRFSTYSLGTSDAFALGELPSVELSDSQKEREAVQIRGDKSQSSEEEQVFAETATRTPPPFGRRLSAFLCDIILLGLVGFCFIMVAETALSENPDGFFPSLKTLIDLSIPYFLVFFCLTFGYFTLFHFLAGQTPGKMITSVQVETVAGESLVFSQAFMRSIGGLIQTLPAGLGYLSVLLNSEGRGWNDRLAGTRLIDLKSLAEEEKNEASGQQKPMEASAEAEKA
ncbi:MAG TPA: RDD family protein [Geopsychrobacteraceae bacterium]|nr:RDD family protein [Geopsychrobacteraceae bacterium]